MMVVHSTVSIGTSADANAFIDAQNVKALATTLFL